MRSARGAGRTDGPSYVACGPASHLSLLLSRMRTRPDLIVERFGMKQIEACKLLARRTGVIV